MSGLFDLGVILMTPGVAAATTPAHRDKCLNRHARGDFGICSEEDAASNRWTIKKGFGEGRRVMSAYPIDPSRPCRGFGANTVWIITERNETTFLLPDEY